jgi:hypothetical protein
MATADETPKGRLFSELYVDPGASRRNIGSAARERLCANFGDVGRYNFADVAEALHLRKGIKIRRPPSYETEVYCFDEFFRDASLVDLLDTITIIAIVLATKRAKLVRDQWVERVGWILETEHVVYRVDELGGVHYNPDRAFERVRVSAVAGLQAKRYGNAGDAVERAYKALGDADGKGAVREVFGAIEIVFRLMINDNKCQRLGSPEIGTFLAPLLKKHYADDEPAMRSAQRLANSLKGWVDGAHFQRHGQPIEEPYQPPDEVAVVLVSQGTAFLRWLTDLDRAMNGGASNSA